MLTPWKESYDQPRQHIKKQRHYSASKDPSNQGYHFSSGQTSRVTLLVTDRVWRGQSPDPPLLLLEVHGSSDTFCKLQAPAFHKSQKQDHSVGYMMCPVPGFEQSSNSQHFQTAGLARTREIECIQRKARGVSLEIRASSLIRALTCFLSGSSPNLSSGNLTFVSVTSPAS